MACSFIHMLNMPTPLYCKVSRIMGHIIMLEAESPGKGRTFPDNDRLRDSLAESYIT
jgi:hypothetical protein